MTTLVPDDPRYPRKLYELDEPPTITVSGSGRLDANIKGRRVVAIVGSRRASIEACNFAFALAYHLAKAGVTIVSGGAKGIDRTAHEGAMQADGGVTWLVSPTGRGLIFPLENADLFERVEKSKTSRIIYPFADYAPKTTESPRMRNGVLVALAECVVVIQARENSGSRNAISWARQQNRPIYVVPAEPWNPGYQGSIEAGVNGAKALWSVEWMMNELHLPEPDMNDPRGILPEVGKPLPKARPRSRRPPRRSFLADPLFPVDLASWSEDEKSVFSALSMAPTQQDEIIVKTGLGTSSALTALLTLSLKDVVVEGPDGFFRRRIAV